MSNLHLPDETLMAYADGELAKDVAGAVETAMMGDASLIGRVVAFMRIRRLTKAAAGPPRHRACAAGHDRSHRSQGCGMPRARSSGAAGLYGRMLAVRWATPALAACFGVIATLAATKEWDQQAPDGEIKPWIPQLSDPAFPMHFRP